MSKYYCCLRLGFTESLTRIDHFQVDDIAYNFFLGQLTEINCKNKKTYLICRRNYISSLKVEDNVYHEDDIDDEIETDPWRIRQIMNIKRQLNR